MHLKVEQGDPYESGGGLRWNYRPRDVDWLKSLLRTVQPSTLKDLLEARMDRWFFHTQRYVMDATGQARLSLEALSRHPPSRTAVGCMHVEERDVLFPLIEQMVQVS
ncbi:MAG: hypothetical protein Q7K57_18810 [Burkholderiaceae bacterium]|nr:hypothetical protein [Burkholderiaceae bacterium]